VTKDDASPTRLEKSLQGQFGKSYDQRKIGNSYPLLSLEAWRWDWWLFIFSSGLPKPRLAPKGADQLGDGRHSQIESRG
jgi:hypothetical protein